MRAWAKFTEVLRNVFDFQRNRTTTAVLLFVFAILSFGWLVNSSTSVVSALGRVILHWMAVPISGDLFEALRRALSEAAGPVAAFLVALGFMWSNYRENTSERSLQLRPPRARKGLSCTAEHI